MQFCWFHLVKIVNRITRMVNKVKARAALDMVSGSMNISSHSLHSSKWFLLFIVLNYPLSICTSSSLPRLEKTPQLLRRFIMNTLLAKEGESLWLSMSLWSRAMAHSSSWMFLRDRYRSVLSSMRSTMMLKCSRFCNVSLLVNFGYVHSLYRSKMTLLSFFFSSRLCKLALMRLIYVVSPRRITFKSGSFKPELDSLSLSMW